MFHFVLLHRPRLLSPLLLLTLALLPLLLLLLLAAAATVTTIAARVTSFSKLTEKGMQQALKLGEFVRRTYVESMGFLPPTLGSGGSNGTYSARFMSDSGESAAV